MARVEISIDLDYLPVLGVTPMGKYSLSDDEYADYLAVVERYREWQGKLSSLKPDGWVVPPPPTKEELAYRAYQLSDEYLDKIAPLPK